MIIFNNMVFMVLALVGLTATNDVRSMVYTEGGTVIFYDKRNGKRQTIEISQEVALLKFNVPALYTCYDGKNYRVNVGKWLEKHDISFSVFEFYLRTMCYTGAVLTNPSNCQYFAYDKETVRRLDSYDSKSLQDLYRLLLKVGPEDLQNAFLEYVFFEHPLCGYILGLMKNGKEVKHPHIERYKDEYPDGAFSNRGDRQRQERRYHKMEKQLALQRQQLALQRQQLALQRQKKEEFDLSYLNYKSLSLEKNSHQIIGAIPPGGVGIEYDAAEDNDVIISCNNGPSLQESNAIELAPEQPQLSARKVTVSEVSSASSSIAECRDKTDNTVSDVIVTTSSPDVQTVEKEILPTVDDKIIYFNRFFVQLMLMVQNLLSKKQFRKLINSLQVFIDQQKSNA